MHEHPLFLISVYLLLAVVLRMMKPNVLTALFLVAVIIPSSIILSAHYGDELLMTAYQARDRFLTWRGDAPSWPPQVLRTYPDIELIDDNGNVVHLSDFRGRVILLQAVATTCPASVAFSGGHARGPYHSTQPQLNLDSIDIYLEQYARISLDDPRFAFVQVLLFNDQMEAPAVEEIVEWETHFGFDRTLRPRVFGGTSQLATAVSRQIVPGFQLIDENFLLRMDSTGFEPQHDLYRELLPLLGELAE